MKECLSITTTRCYFPLGDCFHGNEEGVFSATPMIVSFIIVKRLALLCSPVSHDEMKSNIYQWEVLHSLVGMPQFRSRGSDCGEMIFTAFCRGH